MVYFCEYTKMKPKVFSSIIFIFLLSIVACTPKEEPASEQTQASAAQPVTIAAGSATVAPPPSTTVPAAQAAQVIPAITEIERPTNAQGNPMSDLELLNHLVQELNESRVSDADIPQKTFKTEAEQVAFEAAQEQLRKGPVKDLNELVTAGILKALPQAPAGQRYAIDATTGKVVLQ